MEGRDSASPRATHTNAQHGGHVSFASYFQREYPLMDSSPTIITPTAKRHNSATQPFTGFSNSSTNPNLNYNPSSNSNSIAHNLNTNIVANPNSASPVYFGGAEATAPSPTHPSEFMSSLPERPSSEPVKKKRGRPRKYTNDVYGVSLSNPGSPFPGAVQKKKVSKSVKKAQLSALGSAGQNFTPHVLTVGAGEDVSTKIISFTSQGPWAVCVLSANGAISNATLRHAGVSGGAMTYEGRFEILSLSGSFLLTENSGTRSRTGGLSVSLAGPDGRVIGGGVAGLLMAATPVQVVVGTFFTESSKSRMSNEGISGVKTSILAPPMRMSASAAMVVQPPPNLMEGTEAMQEDPMMDVSGDSDDPRIFRHVPLQSVDCFGSQFHEDTRADTEPESA